MGGFLLDRVCSRLAADCKGKPAPTVYHGLLIVL
jgi:hypothetical protein